jgi:hypothetical protein
MLHSCDVSAGTTWVMSRTTSFLATTAATTAAIAAAAVLAACGSSSPSSSASAGQSSQVSQQQAQQDAVKFTRCMRSHGVPNLPDPTSPQEFKTSLAGKQQLPAFQSAENTCRHLLPGGGPHSQSAARSHAEIAAALAFARCLRSHGFPNFPDPSTNGDITHEMLAHAGINIQQPAAVQAADACVGVTHGLLTKSDVARFVAGR